MKKVLLIIGILLIIASVPVAVFLVQQRKELRLKAAPESVLSFDPATTSTEVGQRFILAVMLEPHNNQVVGVEAYITYNPAVLNYDGFQVGSSMDLVNSVTMPVYNNEQGYISFAVQSLSGVTQTTYLGTLNFEVVGGEGTTENIVYTPISADGMYITKVAAMGESGQNVLTDSQNATITILGSAAATATPTPPVGATSTPTPTAPAATATPTTPEATSTPTTPAGATATPTSTAPTATRTPTPTSVPGATNTPTPTATPTSAPGATNTPTATATPTTAGFNVATPTPTIPVTGINLPTVFSLAMGLVLMAIGILVFL